MIKIIKLRLRNSGNQHYIGRTEVTSSTREIIISNFKHKKVSS